jgi:putative FmdB family regulatory protein
MPAYDYACKKCRKRFSVTMTISEHDSGKVRCPKCKSLRVEQQIRAFFAQTSKKS